MTPRENFINFFKDAAYEWTPTNVDQLQFRPAFIPDNIARGFVVQQNGYTGPFGGKDMFGIEWIYQEEQHGSMEAGHLFDDIEDWREHVVFPDLDAMDWEKCAEENKDYLQTDKLIYTTIYSSFFERLISFVGFENAAIALIDEDQCEAVAELFDALADYYIRFISRLHRHFNVEMVEIHDDWGTQVSTMFSRETLDNLIMPRLRRVIEAAHEEGVIVELHSCGFIEDFVPAITASGVDTWMGQNNNDKKKLVELYGKDFRFGICILLDDPIPLDDMKAVIRSHLEEYAGKKVWLAIFGYVLTPAMHEALGEYVREYGLA